MLDTPLQRLMKGEEQIWNYDALSRKWDQKVNQHAWPPFFRWAALASKDNSNFISFFYQMPFFILRIQFPRGNHLWHVQSNRPPVCARFGGYTVPCTSPLIDSIFSKRVTLARWPCLNLSFQKCSSLYIPQKFWAINDLDFINCMCVNMCRSWYLRTPTWSA